VSVKPSMDVGQSSVRNGRWVCVFLVAPSVLACSPATMRHWACEQSFIEFWSLKPGRCSKALDRLDDMAACPAYKDVRFAAICCGAANGSPDMVEAFVGRRWSNMSHYFMNYKSKERAKRVLHFRSIPFYVVLDELGHVVQRGRRSQVDFGSVSWGGRMVASA
jgi:hypothetical protein